MLLSASILAVNPLRVEREIREYDAGVDWYHVDIMDGSFVPQISFGQSMAAALRGITDKPLDAHFMVRDAVPMIGEFAKIGVDGITVHAEAVTHLHRALAQIRELGLRAGVAVNPATPPEAIEYVLDMADMVLVMTVNPGYGGQKMIPLALEKARAVKEMIARSGRDILLQIDGGVNAETIEDAARVGVDVVVAGSALFTGGGLEFAERVRAL